MPFVNVKLVEGVFNEEEKHQMAAELTDVMVRYEGSEAFRDVVWVLIEELHADGWHIAGRPFHGPASLMGALAHSKATYEAIDGQPATRAEFASAAPPATSATPGPSPGAESTPPLLRPDQRATVRRRT